MAQDITLTSSLFPTGTIYCRGASLKYSFKPLTKTTPLTNQWDLAETQTAGFENPKIIIKGYIDTNHMGVKNINSNLINQPHLLLMGKNQYDGTINTSIILKVKTGSQNVPLYGIDGTTDGIRVAVESFDIGLDTNSDLAHLWVYTITFVETK